MTALNGKPSNNPSQKNSCTAGETQQEGPWQSKQMVKTLKPAKYESKQINKLMAKLNSQMPKVATSMAKA